GQGNTDSRAPDREAGAMHVQHVSGFGHPAWRQDPGILSRCLLAARAVVEVKPHAVSAVASDERIAVIEVLDHGDPARGFLAAHGHLFGLGLPWYRAGLEHRVQGRAVEPVSPHDHTI